MQNWKKKLCLVIAVLVISTSAAGCGASSASASASEAVSSTESVTVEETQTETATDAESSVETAEVSAAETEAAAENTFSYEDTETEAPADTTLTAKVSAIDDNVLTLEVGEFGSTGGQPGSDGETPPDKPDGDEADGQQNGGDAASAPAEQNGEGGGQSGSDGETPPDKPDGDETDGQQNGGDAAAAPAEQNGEGGGQSSSDGETPPDKPDGDEADGQQNGGDADTAAPEKPEDAQNSGDGQEPADAGSATVETEAATLTIGDESVITVSGEQGTLEDITEGSMLSITFDADGVITEIAVSDASDQGSGMGGPGGGSSASDISYTAVSEYTEDTTLSDESISSTGTDENAVLVSGDADVTLDSVTVDRTSSDSTGGDNSSFYGVGAAVLGTAGNTYIRNSTITTDAAGGAGVFAYGDGTVYVSDSTISTEQNTSGGIHAAGGGTLYAWQLAVETNGESAAAIRSDRGGGTMVIDGGTYTSNGVGSPAIYCTADIAVNDAELTANGSEAICMEGLNTIHLFDCDIVGDMQDLDQNDTTWNIIVYQSMSGDSEVGSSNMQIIGGSLTAKNGGMIYTTNTECNILLSDVDITYAEDSEFFLQCTGNNNQRGWGTSGANGSDCTFTADSQEMQGKVIWDSISNLDFYMTDGSQLTGSFEDDESYAGEGGDGVCNVYISEDSVWTVTGDSVVTNLYNAGTIEDEDGNTVSIVGTDGTVYVSGTGAYTITVSSYSDTADLSGAAEADSWSNHEVEMPSELQ